MIVVDAGKHCVHIFTAAGKLLKTFGKFGANLGEFHSPWGVAVEKKKGFILVSDTHNHRIQVLSCMLVY